MSKKQFKAESKRMLDLMINSIYTNREIFLREIISNASDAIDKRYYEEAKSGKTGLSRENFEIRIEPNKDDRTLTISDNGIGMSAEELEENLGIIAKSGSLGFKTENEEAAKDTDIIGQFGVGFYSAFMVAKHIEVTSRKLGEEQAHVWISDGADGYSVEDGSRDEVGTTVQLTLRDDTEDDKYDEFLEEYRLRSLVTKYSDYIRYPIVMNVEKSKMKEASEEEKAKEDYQPEYETYREDERLNSMVPIWKKKKSEITAEEYNEFYKSKFFDWNDPLKVIHTNVEGVISYDALLFIPSQVPFNYYTKDFKKGLQLYSSGVLIMDKCADLLPEHFRFVRGVVDSPDLSLNISRELLQHDRQLKVIAANLEKKIKSELGKMLKDERESYEIFWKNFGRQIKYGVTADYGAHKELLQDLLLFYSSTEKKLVTLDEYVSRMKEDQKVIYYAAGETVDKIDKLPQLEALKDQGMEILYFTEEVDEFAAQILHTYKDKEFRSAMDGAAEESAQEKAKEAADAHKDVFSFVKETLGDAVSEVKPAVRLKSHPVCLTAGEGLSFEMEKYFQMMQPESGIKAQRILELNTEHPVFAALEAAVTADPEKAKKYARLLYDQALLIAGLPLDDPSGYTDLVCELMK